MRLVPSFLTKDGCVFIIGTTLGVSGVALLMLWSRLLNRIIDSMLILKPNSFMQEVWESPPIDISLDFYFFNWTNPEEIHDSSKKPTFKEIGPYKFKEQRIKVNISWNPNNTITYRLLRIWHFNEKGSNGKLWDQVTTLNAVTASAAHHIRDWSYIMKRGLSISIATLAPQVHITKTIAEMLFDGYKDPFVDLGRSTSFIADSLPPYDKFGWFYMRNNSYIFDGVFNIATGGESNNIGELLQWNYNGQTPYFTGNCSKVHGSAAELYPKKPSRDFIGFFSPDMCRYVKLDYESDVFVNGVEGFKYAAHENMLDNGTIVAENKCYCNGECVPSGLLNVSSCRYGTPAFVSLPHFYGADPVYVTLVDGLRPNRSKHEVFLTLEPRTGVALDVAIRLQLNLHMKPIEGVTLYEDVPNVFFPMLWFEQRVTIPDHLAWQMKLLQNSPTIFNICSFCFIGIGIIVLIISCRKTIKKHLCCIQPKNATFSLEEVPLRKSTRKPYVPNIKKSKYLDVATSE